MAHSEVDLLTGIRELAHKAGRAILNVYETNFDVVHKDDRSPLTEADLAAHRMIQQGLERLTPSMPQISEESVAPPYEVRRQWSRYWLIDPLDGTREFVERNGEFTVNIALIERDEPVLGVVYAPVLDRAYFAARGEGAFRAEGEGPGERVRVRDVAGEPVIVAGSRSHGTEALKAFLARLGPHELQSMGSSLKICLVAEGEADIYPRLGPTSEWDTAAAQCIVEEAGGRVTDVHLERLRYNAKDSLLNPWFLVFGDRNRNWSSYLADAETGAGPNSGAP